MNRKLFFAAMSVMLLTLFAFGSGCGGSSSSLSSDDTQVSGGVVGSTVYLGLDRDDDNKPDVLDFDGVQQLHAKTDGTELHGTVPFMVWMSSLPAQASPDIITADLAARTTYTFEVSKNLADPLGGRIPDVEIFDPSGNPVDAKLTVYPEEQPSMILYTITPAVSGRYTAEISNADGNTEGDTDCVLFVYREMQNSDAENGYYARFIIANEDLSITSEASVTDIIQLRKNFLAAHPYYLNEVYGEGNLGTDTRNVDNENGEDITENTGDYDNWMDIMRHRSGIIDDDEEAADAESAEFTSAADAGRTQIDTTVYGVPYEDEYQLGAGFMATTNLQALNETALEPFTLTAPTSADKVGTTRFTYSFISSKEDYEQKMGRNFSLGLTKAALGISSSVQTTNNMKFGLTSTTLVIHYEELENNYRSLPLKDYKLTEDAMEIANEYGSDTFREEFGDYFVAGYQYGGMYDAYVTITTETSEQLEKVKFELEAKLKTMTTVKSQDVVSTSADAKFSQESEEILKKNKAQISVEIRTIGAGTSSPEIVNLPNSQDIAAMGSLVGELTKFRNAMAGSFTPNHYVPVNVMLRRYRSLSGMLKKIDAYIPVPPEESANIMAFNRALVNMRGYFNVIGGLPNNKIDASVRADYTDKFHALIDPVRAGGNAFYLSMDKIAQALPKVQALSKELKAIGDRYTFYSMLVNAQEKESSLAGTTITSKPFGENGGSTGYQSFGVSAAVTEDIKAGKADQKYYHEVVNIGWKTWYPELDAGEGFIHCWFGLLCKNTHDNIREVIDPPAVGKKVSKFHFEAGYDRDAEWYINYQTMRFTRELYPFAGLK